MLVVVGGDEASLSHSAVETSAVAAARTTSITHSSTARDVQPPATSKPKSSSMMMRWGGQRRPDEHWSWAASSVGLVGANRAATVRERSHSGTASAGVTITGSAAEDRLTRRPTQAMETLTLPRKDMRDDVGASWSFEEGVEEEDQEVQEPRRTARNQDERMDRSNSRESDDTKIIEQEDEKLFFVLEISMIEIDSWKSTGTGQPHIAKQET